MVDVIVVGGGPAGAATAAWLAEQGHAVVVLDRARFPRDKACGEFLTPQAAHLLRQLGVWDALRREGLRDVTATLLAAPDGRQVLHTPQNGGPAGYALRRTALDATLLSHARMRGADVEEGFVVRELCRDSQGKVAGVSGKDAQGEPRTLHARLVIGADGTHSLAARQLQLVQPVPRLQRIAVVAHWYGTIGGRQDTIEMRTHGPLVCGLGFPGDPDHADGTDLCANTTFVVPADWASQIAGRAPEWVEQTLQAHFPDLAARLSGCKPQLRTVGCFGHRCRAPFADGALLVGDAATFIDPFTGEGVYFCLRGAQLAAEVADAALQAGDTSAHNLQPYATLRRELARRYLLIDIVQTVVRTPALFNSLARRLDRYPGAAERLLQVLGDTRPATHALHPLLLWRLFAPCF